MDKIRWDELIQKYLQDSLEDKEARELLDESLKVLNLIAQVSKEMKKVEDF